MDVDIREKTGKWEVCTDGICYDKYDTKTEAQEIATRLKRIVGLMDKLQAVVKEETTEWDEADKAMFREFYGASTAEVLYL